MIPVVPQIGLRKAVGFQGDLDALNPRRQQGEIVLSFIPLSRFTGQQVPEYLWPDLIDEFGIILDYHLVEGDVVAGLQGMLLEGMEGEFRSGGRYARCLINHRDLPREPQASDWIDLDGTAYDIESVEATHYEISRCVIKLSGQSWLAR